LSNLDLLQEQLTHALQLQGPYDNVCYERDTLKQKSETLEELIKELQPKASKLETDLASIRIYNEEL